MAKQHGKGSSVIFPNLTVGDYEATVNDGVDTVEVTDFADGAAGFKKYIAGLRDWTVTILGRWDDTPNTAVPGASGTLEVQLSGAGTLKFAGPAILVSQTIVASVNDAITHEWTFQGNGAFTQVPA